MKNMDTSNAQNASTGAATTSSAPAAPVTTGPNATHDIDGDPIPSWVPQHIRDGNGHPPSTFVADRARAQLAQLEEEDKRRTVVVK